MKDQEKLIIDFEEYAGSIEDMKMVLLDFMDSNKRVRQFKIKTNLIKSSHEQKLTVNKLKNTIEIQLNSYFAHTNISFIYGGNVFYHLTQYIKYSLDESQSLFGHDYKLTITCSNSEIMDEILKNKNYLIDLINNTNRILDYHHHIELKKNV